MAEGTKIRHLCKCCGCKLYFYGDIDTRNYVYHHGLYLCKECFSDIDKVKRVLKKYRKKRRSL